ncbi:MAG: hypothetical protein GX580_13025 [Candidatus Hydrogenedens sp.]|nr:hypothetical protein [Candidatus Hydrogenedentota bacterium]NLF58549.1 hypothetical protein [Candidatus Hydrogenedens sp.]
MPHPQAASPFHSRPCHPPPPLTIPFRAVAAVLLCFALTACSPGGPPPQSELVLTTANGVKVAATLHRPPAASTTGGPPPGLILAHRHGGDRQIWEGFAAFARGLGYLSVAVDLHGLGGETDDWRGELAALAAAKAALLEHGADPENLAVLGEELGASLALLYALDEPAMQAVVMLSPGLELRGIDAESAIRRLKDCPVLILSAQNDAYAASSAAALKAAAPVFAEAQSYSGAAQGADLFAANGGAMSQVTQWLKSVIGPKSP